MEGNVEGMNDRKEEMMKKNRTEEKKCVSEEIEWCEKTKNDEKWREREEEDNDRTVGRERDWKKKNYEDRKKYRRKIEEGKTREKAESIEEK